MNSQREIDFAALHKLDELKNLRENLRKVAENLQKLERALNNPVHWTLTGSVRPGYGEYCVGNVQLPDIKVLGQKVEEYQIKHFELTRKLLSDLSPSVRRMVEQELRM
jgi:hypothetical protein